MRFFDRWTRGRPAADDASSEEEMAQILEAFQPISSTTSQLPPELHDAFVAACAAQADLQAVYVFDSDFGGVGEPLLTVGLVLDETSDVERFVVVSRALRPLLESAYGDDLISQHLSAHSLDRVEGSLRPIYERS
jgi:hypothetical protein